MAPPRSEAGPSYRITPADARRRAGVDKVVVIATDGRHLPREIQLYVFPVKPGLWP